MTFDGAAVQTVNLGRQYLSANHHLAFRLFKAFLFLGVVATIVTLSLICHLSLKDLIVCCLAFLPTGWGMILVSSECSPDIVIIRKPADPVYLFCSVVFRLDRP